MDRTLSPNTELPYIWSVLQGDEQVATGCFQTKAVIEYESPEAFEAGDAPVKVYHLSAQMKSRKRAYKQLRETGKLQSYGSWGKWRAEKNGDARSVPLIVDGQEAFRLHLEVRESNEK